MTHREIVHIISARKRRMTKQIKALRRLPDGESIHQFRIEFKKLRAFCRLLSFARGKGRLSVFTEKIKNLYRLSGRLRNVLLQQQWAVKSSFTPHGIPAAYTGELEENHLQLLGLLDQKLQQHHWFKKTKKTYFRPVDITRSIFNAYAENQWRKIYRHLGKGFPEDYQLHAIRKKLKDIQYNLSACQASFKKKADAVLRTAADPESLEDLLEALGKFQDDCSTIDLLNTGWKENRTRAALDFWKRKWMEKKNKTRQVLIRRLINELPAVGTGPMIIKDG